MFLNPSLSDGKSASTLVDLHVEDVNDHAPHFEAHEYHAILRENRTYSAPILNVFATDADRGDFGQLQYFVEEVSDGSAKFRVDSTNGAVYLDKPLDGKSNEIEVKVNARDGGGMSSTQSVGFQDFLIDFAKPIGTLSSFKLA